MTTINFVVIGYGGMGAYHVSTLLPNENERFHVLGTLDINKERQLLAEGRGYRNYLSLEEVLSDAAVDAVLIATPNDTHKDLAIAALLAGKHVVCEKPVAMNTQELDDIIAVAEESNRVFMVHQNRRWDPDFLVVRRLFHEQMIGDVFQLESRVHGANGIPGDWRHMKAQGGGMLLDWGVHLLDQILWLVDSPIEHVFADLSFVLGNGVDDGFVAHLTFENGIKAVVEVGTTNYTQLPRWYVKGTEGSARIDDWEINGSIIKATRRKDVAAPIPVQAGVGLTKTMAPPSEAATETLDFPASTADYSPFYRNFHDVVRNGAEPIVKNSEVRQVMQLIDAIFETLEQHNT